jgi:ubiquinone/menaquinone biosynthesis C-methylase UbiE
MMKKKGAGSREVEKYYDSVSAIYDRREEGAMHRLYTALTWPWILGNLPTQRCRILDAGGGTGKTMIDNFESVTGWAVDNVATTAKIHALNLPITKSPSFDCCFYHI